MASIVTAREAEQGVFLKVNYGPLYRMLRAVAAHLIEVCGTALVYCTQYSTAPMSKLYVLVKA